MMSNGKKKKKIEYISTLGLPSGSRVPNNIFFHDPLQSLFRPRLRRIMRARGEAESKLRRGNGRKSEKKLGE
jgi:hypothetical protein